MLDPTHRVVGDLAVDLPAHLWVIWYTGQDPTVANAPFGADFYALEQLNVLLEHGLGFLGRELAHNVAAFVALIVAGIGGHRLGTTLSTRPHSGLMGAVLLMSSPPMVDALNDGTAEFSWVGFAALAVAGFLRRSWWAALWVAVTAWTCWYYGLMVGLAGLMLAAWRRDPRILLTLALGTAAVLPFALSFAGSDLEVTRGAGAIDAPQHRLPPWMPFGQRHLLWSAVLIPATFTLRRHPEFAVLALAGWSLTWGTAVGEVLLPFGWLNAVLGTFARPMHLPFHFNTLMVLALIPLSCAVRWRPWVGLIIAAALLAPAPPGSTLPSPSPLAQLDRDGMVIELPGLFTQEQAVLDREALHQLVHQQPIPRFPVFPTNALKNEGVQALRSDPWLAGVMRGQGGPPSLTAWVVVPTDAPELNEALRQSAGAPRFEGDGLSVYWVLKDAVNVPP